MALRFACEQGRTGKKARLTGIGSAARRIVVAERQQVGEVLVRRPVRCELDEREALEHAPLHELAHGYHDKVLTWDQPDIIAAYEHAKAAKLYDRVERWHGTGIPNNFERAYAMSNHKEYFAEVTEAYFARNDFFPFTRDELEKHDPEVFAVLKKVWGGK